MRLTLVFAALGLITRHVAGQQQQWQDFGAMPDLMKQPFYDDVARRPSLAKRDGDCGEGQHPCSNLNSTLCCANTHYCIINETSLDVQCCQLGSTCGGSCDTDSYFTLQTTTQTTSGTTATETNAVCIGFPCASTQYKCPQSMGGNCCAYGQNCASSGVCLDYGATTSSSTTAGPTVATMIPSGCSQQGDTPCSVGGPGIATSTGCCGVGYTCGIGPTSEAICTSTPTSSTSGPGPTGSGISVVPQSRGLSTGAKAGIAVGVVVAAALVIGAATWFCLRRRRSARSTTTGNEMASGVGASGIMGAGGRPNRLAPAGRYESDDGGIHPYGPSSGPHMSEADGYAASSHGGGGGGPLPGLTNDYFGPVAASGPYTTPPDQQYPNAHYYGGGGGPDDPARPVRGDGAAPHGPDDIASAVEIGGGVGVSKEDGVRGRKADDEGSELDGGSDTMLAARRQNMRQGTGSPTVRDSIAGRFELYGTDVPVGAVADTRAPRPLGTPGSELSASELGTPSPMSHEELQQQQQQQESNRRAAG